MEPLGFDVPGAAPAEGGPIELLGLVAALRTRKRWVAIPTLLSFAAALMFAPRETGITMVLLATLAGFSLAAVVAIAKALLADAPDQAIRQWAAASAEPD